MKSIDQFRKEYELENMPIKTIDRNCKLYGFRVELFKYNHKRNNLSDYKNRNRIILHQEK